MRLKKFKKECSYAIYRLFEDGEPDIWDGPFRSLTEARNTLLREYSAEDGQAPKDFIIVKITAEKVELNKKKKQQTK